MDIRKIYQPMRENVLHFIWQYGLFNKDRLYTLDGEKVEYIHPGRLNPDSGPDFFNARLRIGGLLLAGNVELHTEGPDWYLHGHQDDAAYSNVILHVVFRKGCRTQVLGKEIPVLELHPFIEKAFWQTYTGLQKRSGQPACTYALEQVPGIYFTRQWEKAGIERIQEKARRLQELFEYSGQRIDQAFFILLCRNFGFGINTEAGQMLGLRTDVKILARHRQSLFQLEAILLGMAGFLEDPGDNAYALELRKEFLHIRRLFPLTPMQKHLWKFSKTRPGNFPTVRLAQLAALIHHSGFMVNSILQADDPAGIRNLFRAACSDFWATHYDFNSPRPHRQAKPGEHSIDGLLINSAVPLMAWEAVRSENAALMEKTVELLQSLPPEDNRHTRIYAQWEAPLQNAFDSQAAYHQHKRYCRARQCISCLIGNKILRNGTLPAPDSS